MNYLEKLNKNYNHASGFSYEEDAAFYMYLTVAFTTRNFVSGGHVKHALDQCDRLAWQCYEAVVKGKDIEKTLTEIKSFNLKMPFKYRNFQAALESLMGVTWHSAKKEIKQREGRELYTSRMLREAREYYKNVVKNTN